MIFDINQTEFPTARHKAIWNEGRQVVPLDVSLADIAALEMKEGCTQIYNWTREYFEQIYKDPAQFSGYTPHGMFRLLDIAAKKTTVEGGGLVVTGRKYKQMLSSSEKHLSDFPLVGLEITGGDTKLLTNKKYPLFCKYLKLFSDGAYRKPLNSLMYILYNDFRVLAPKYIRTFDDLLRVLPDKIKDYATEAQEYVLAKGAELENHKAYGQFRYKYKGRYLLVLQRNNYRHTPLDIAVPYGPIEKYKELIENQPDRDEIVMYVKKEINVCDTVCVAGIVAGLEPHGYCGKSARDIFGDDKNISLCYQSISKWTAAADNSEYTDYDIKMLKRLIDIRLSQLDILSEGDTGKPRAYFPTNFINVKEGK